MSVKEVKELEKRINESKFDDNNIKRADVSDVILSDILKRAKGEDGQMSSDVFDEVCRGAVAESKVLKVTALGFKTSKALKDGTL